MQPEEPRRSESGGSDKVPRPELTRGLHLGLEDPLASAREDVVVVEDRRAAGQRELREPRARRRVLRLGVDPRPHRVELAQPGEQVRLLGPCAREGLVEVMVRVDKTRENDVIGEVQDFVGSRW